ncbi:MAG: leucine-rich repeat protein [Bacteroidales bacterium]|nr:leucine-rich repeat protein [Bacteroidales bacterium]
MSGQTTPTAKLLNPDGNAWQNSGYSWACNMEPNENNGLYNESYLKARIGYLCDDDFGGMTLVNLIRLEKEEGEAFVNREPQEYFRRTCLSVSYDKDWVTWPDDATRNNTSDVDGIVIPDSQYPAVVYAYSVPNAEHPGCYDVYYYVSDDSNPLVTGTCAKLFKTGFDSEQTCGGQKIFYTSNYEDLSGIAYWDFENVTNLDQMFANCTKIIDIDLNGVFSNSSGISTIFKNCTALESVSITGITNKFTSFASMFANLLNLTDVTISGDFSGVTTANKMFSGCISLTTVNLDGDFLNLKDAEKMFQNCTSLPEVTLSGSFKNVTTTHTMFNNCPELVSVNMPGDLLKNTVTYQMFQNCKKLTTIANDLTFSNTLTNMGYMFSGCSVIPSIVLKGDFSGVQHTHNMFNNSTNISSIIIGDPITGIANFSSLTNAQDMFKKWPESKYDVFKDFISQINLNIDKFPGGKSNPYRVTSSGISGRWRGGVDGDTVVTANGLVYRMDNGYMTYWHLLPIDLWKFNVSQDNDNLLFAWKTACETNNECFILEYSLDGSSYSTIAQLAGAGNSSRINSYSTVWESVPYTGMLYFRLKQRDFSGHITYSNVIAHNMVCNPCKDDSLPKIYYGTSQYRVFNKKLIFCKGDNNKE